MRTLLIAFGIILGVAGLLAIQITNQTALDSLLALFAGTAGRTDLIITYAGKEKSGLPERVLRRILESPEIEIAVPSLQIQTTLAIRSGESVMPLSMLGFDMGGIQIFGIDPWLDRQIRDYRIVEGDFLQVGREAQEIVLVKNYAEDNNLTIGKRVGVLTPNGEEEFEIVGLLSKEGAGQTNNGNFAVIPLRVAQELFNRSGELDQIDLVVKPVYKTTERLEVAKKSLQSCLGNEFAVTTTAAQGERVNQMLNGFTIGLNFMAGMALFVGGYLIYNAFSMTVVERTREFGLLRTLGLTRRQIAWQVLTEAALLGLGGALVGAFLGVQLARGASGLLAYLLELDQLKLNISPSTIFMGVLVGVSVTLAAAFVPAWQAGRISPLEALRVRGLRREGWLIRQGWKLGLVLLFISTVILVVNPFPYDVQFRLGSMTVVTLFLGGTLLIPGSVGVWEKFSRPVVSFLYGAAGQLGSNNIQRNRLRTTLTVAALMVGISMIIITRGMTDSFRGDLELWIDAYVGGDLLVSSATPMRSQVMQRLETIRGVEAVTPMRTVGVTWQREDGTDEELIFAGVDTSTYDKVTSFVFSDSRVDGQAAYQRLASGKAIFISSVLAEKYGLKAGDTMRLRTRGGSQDFKIAAIVVNFFNQGLTIQGSWQDMRRYFKVEDANAYLVKVAKGFDIETVQELIKDTYGERENLSVISNRSVIDRVFTLLNQAYSMFDAMAMIALLVGALGIVNTLTMNVLERTQEIGMLRSIGLTRGQTLVMVLAEALLMGVVGGFLGIGFGVVLTRIFLWSMTAMSGYKITFMIPPGAVLISLLVALVVSQLAAVIPARRAAKTKILEAIHYE